MTAAAMTAPAVLNVPTGTRTGRLGHRLTAPLNASDSAAGAVRMYALRSDHGAVRGTTYRRPTAPAAPNAINAMSRVLTARQAPRAAKTSAMAIRAYVGVAVSETLRGNR